VQTSSNGGEREKPKILRAGHENGEIEGKWENREKSTTVLSYLRRVRPHTLTFDIHLLFRLHISKSWEPTA
jgi:hypothetical protein